MRCRIFKKLLFHLMANALNNIILVILCWIFEEAFTMTDFHVESEVHLGALALQSTVQ